MQLSIQKTDTSFISLSFVFIPRFQQPHIRYLATSYLLKMKSFAVLAFATTALAQASPPAGCQASTSGTFQISTVNVTSSKKRDLESRQLAGALTLSLQSGNLKDQAGRVGYIASNYQ